MNKTRYDLTTDTETFYKWLETCPVHYRFTKLDNDYVEFGFFSVIAEGENHVYR